MAIAAAALHHSHRAAWPLVAAVTAAVAVALAVPVPERWRQRWPVPGRPIERAYAAVVVAFGGGWLAAATAIGPTAPPLPLVALTGTAACAVPWWAHRRRRAKVRIQRTLDAWPEMAKAIGLAGSHVQSAVVDLWGWRARFALARGQTIEDVTRRIPAIESALGTYRGAVRVLPTPDDLANRFELRVLDRDPHADAIPWPGPSMTSITEPVDLGPFEDAAPCRVLLLRRHMLIGGTTGSGKSGGINVLIGNLTACRDVVIWAVDLKRGMELRPWAATIDRLATTPAEAHALLADAVAVLEDRAAELAAVGRRSWEPAPEMPALVIVVDEYAELAETASEATADADSIARRGRAVAVTLIAATQRPTQKAMGQGALRSQMDVRVAFRVRERKDVDLILGQGMLAARWHAHKLNAPGKFLISAAEHDVPRRTRGYLLTDETVQHTAERHADLRPALDEASQQAITARHSLHPGGPTGPGHPSGRPSDDPVAEPGHEGHDSSAIKTPEAILWAALSVAPEEGTDIAELMRNTGMTRPTLYRHLAEHVRAGRAIQVSRGRWRASTTAQGPHDE